MASAIAQCGLGTSILTGNDYVGVFGRIETRDQVGLLFVVVMVFALAALKLRESRRSAKAPTLRPVCRPGPFAAGRAAGAVMQTVT